MTADLFFCGRFFIYDHFAHFLFLVLTNSGNMCIIQVVQIIQIVQIGGETVDIFRSGKQDVYLAVAERYERYIKSGVLKSGDKLPSVRVAAEELGVNPNTVQKAYTLLESRGFIYSVPKKGAFVCSSDPDKRKSV